MNKNPSPKTLGKKEEPSPEYEDFMPRALKKALLKHSLEHWTFQYSVVGVLLSALSIPLFGFTEPIFLALVSTFGLSGFSWIWNYVINSEKFIHKHVERLQKSIIHQTNRKRKQLRENLRHHNHSKGVEQLELVQKKFDTYIEVLELKFNPRELTYKRYYGIGQEVFLSAIDNLSAVVLSLKSLEGADRSRILGRIKQLNEKDKASLEEKAALMRRLDLYDKERQKVKQLMAENEAAITQIGETTIALSNIDVKDKEGKIDMENSMRELIDMTKRAEDYSS